MTGELYNYSKECSSSEVSSRMTAQHTAQREEGALVTRLEDTGTATVSVEAEANNIQELSFLPVLWAMIVGVVDRRGK